MARIHIDSTSVYYTHVQNHLALPTILFIHGSGGSHKSWPHQLHAFTKTNVILPDLPGHGLSTGKGYDSVEKYADFINAYVLDLNLTQVILAGHSLGGAVAQAVALSNPAWLSGLILVGTGMRLRVHPDILKGILKNYPRSVDLICHWAFSPDAPEHLIEESRRAMLKTDPAVTYGDFSACNAFDIGQEVENIKSRTLILSASKDRLTPPKYGRYLHKRIPNSEYHLIEDAGHMMALEQPEQFLGFITAFVDPFE